MKKLSNVLSCSPSVLIGHGDRRRSPTTREKTVLHLSSEKGKRDNLGNYRQAGLIFGPWESHGWSTCKPMKEKSGIGNSQQGLES